MIETLHVGPSTFVVKRVDGLRDSESTLFGRIEYSSCEIEIENTLCPQAQYQTIWHEIVHAILVQSGRENHDEGMVNAISYGIIDVLQRNPEMRMEEMIFENMEQK